MSDRNPYEQLEVAESATFEEIQESRNRLMAQHSGDKQRLQSIEVAYDAILMERLRIIHSLRGIPAHVLEKRRVA